MSETPDTLRALADEVDAEMVFRYEHQRRMRRHAAAWETQNDNNEKVKETLRKRLEEAET